jgi:colanic acid/amylovoran biosynthesis glycosyltransferase
LSCRNRLQWQWELKFSRAIELKKIAYLVPEFPGQTHIFFWRERQALQRMGVVTYQVSTRRPPKGIVSHDWADRAESETFYLADIGARDILPIAVRFLRFGPAAWGRAIRAAKDGCPPRDWFFNFALVIFATHLIGFMRSKKLTHIHSHSCADSALVAMLANRLANVSYSLTLHGDLQDYGGQQRVKWRHAAFAVTITRKLYDQVHQELSGDIPPNMGLAPMGVDPSIFIRKNPYKPWAGEGRLRLFSCGRLNFIKGHQDLIRAVSILRDSGMTADLEIAGEDEAGGSGFRRELETIITKLKLADSVVLLGAVNEQRVLEGLEAAHLFVLPSHHEPLGVAIMEALSCETPVIATNLGGVTELIDHGVDGFLVAPKDPDSLAAAIKYVADNRFLAKQFSAAGRSKILRRFNCDVSAMELKRLIMHEERS